jgi:hypothetical protein
MLFRYTSGEEIIKGDRITLHGNPGEIEDLVTPDDNADWDVKRQGGGCMIREPRVFGRILLKPTDSDFAELKLVSRDPSANDTD